MLTTHTFASTFLAIATTSSAETFREDFSEGLASERWKVSTWTAPRHGATNVASFSASHVVVKDGILRLKLSQKRNADGSITSVGGEIMTVAKFGYGIYTLVMRASSDSSDSNKAGQSFSGSITGAGPYLSLSETEIDIEVEGLSERNSLTQFTTWVNEEVNETTKVPIGRWDPPHLFFHTYRIIWTPDSVQFFQNGVAVAVHKKIVPKKPAAFLLNHWGTNDNRWGGVATPDVDRYVFIKSFSFTPLQPAKNVITPNTFLQDRLQ